MGRRAASTWPLTFICLHCILHLPTLAYTASYTCLHCILHLARPQLRSV